MIYLSNIFKTAVALLLFLFVTATIGKGQTVDQFEKIIFGCASGTEKEFQDFADQVKALGATHVTITAEDLPLAYWELKPENDPYPAWVMTNPGLLKIAPPDHIEPFIPSEYSKKIMSVIRERCKILKKLDLQAVFHTFEPQMLPDSVFIEHPEWLGPQVDNPMRARVSRFAPSMSHPQVLEFYTQAVETLIKDCPEINILEMRTNDSGAGIEWSPALYAGANGNSLYRSMAMEERIFKFLSALQKGALSQDSDLDVHIYNAKDDEQRIAKHFDPGMAIDNREGPDARRFKAQVGSLLYYRRAFAPVPGIPWPFTFLEELQTATDSDAKRLFIAIGDRFNKDLYLQIYEKFRAQPTFNLSDRLSFLHDVAQARVGTENAAMLVNLWMFLKDAEDLSHYLSAGGTVFILGCVHQRWLTRPFVPFPEELTDEEKDYYRRFQFQSRTEAHAKDLLDLQASRFIDGFNGYRLVSRLLHRIKSNVRNARRLADRLYSETNEEQFRVLRQRLKVFSRLIENVDHAMAYQVHLDRLKKADTEPEMNPPYPFLRPADLWTRLQLMSIAREEIDTITALIELLQKEERNQPLLDRAGQPDEEYHRLLAPKIIDQLQKKLYIMRSHWEDYNRITYN
ncbi:hypothetical protein GF406_05955 [candidate division KSB1 bacterium]|nr:hypothetical protein [candidate division KSB1 bacterium]